MKQQVNLQDTDTPLGAYRPRSSRWIRKKWSELLRSSILLLDDIARPQSATAMQNHIATLGWECLHHLPYSPDLTPSDFHLFPALKKNLAGRHFGSNIKSNKTFNASIVCKSPEFFQESFLKLIKRYEKCSNVLGTHSMF
ncbi:histone-lysine N-methyltransferase SETMAR [Trichonephila clavipes]|nr:histone-lysine N-methyltransferase SETMAR [Trichonephila clavipes]